MALVLSPLAFSLIERNLSGLPMFVCIPNLFCALYNLSFSCVFLGTISVRHVLSVSKVSQHGNLSTL